MVGVVECVCESAHRFQCDCVPLLWNMDFYERPFLFKGLTWVALGERGSWGCNLTNCSVPDPKKKQQQNNVFYYVLSFVMASCTLLLLFTMPSTEQLLKAWTNK